jgi:hypothetical protein
LRFDTDVMKKKEGKIGKQQLLYCYGKITFSPRKAPPTTKKKELSRVCSPKTTLFSTSAPYLWLRDAQVWFDRTLPYSTLGTRSRNTEMASFTKPREYLTIQYVSKAYDFQKVFRYVGLHAKAPLGELCCGHCCQMHQSSTRPQASRS